MDVAEKSEEVNVSLIHQKNGIHFDAHLIHCSHIMFRCFRKMLKNWNAASHVNLCMHYTSLVLAELSPCTKFDTETDGGTVESIYHIVKIKPELVFRVK